MCDVTRHFHNFFFHPEKRGYVNSFQILCSFKLCFLCFVILLTTFSRSFDTMQIGRYTDKQ